MAQLAADAPAHNLHAGARTAQDQSRHAGAVFAVGLLMATLIMSAPKFRLFSSLTWNTGWLINAAPFVVAALLMVRTDIRSRVLGCSLLLVAALLVLMAEKSPLSMDGPGLADAAWMAADVTGLAGWFVLRRRPLVCYSLLAPMALIGYLFGLNSWIVDNRTELLWNAGVSWPSAVEAWSWSSVVWHVSTFLDLAVAVLLAYAAALWARRHTINRAVRTASASTVPAAASAGGYDAGFQTPGSTMTARYGSPAPYPGQGATNGSAIASLVCGLIGMLAFFPAAIAAVVCGHVARRQIARTGERGAGMALAGLILGYLGVAITVLIVVFFIMLVSAAGSLPS
jgi:hypothetical protein